MDPAAQVFQPSGMELGLIVVGVVLSLIATVCSIMVCVKMFQNKQTGLGVASLILMFCTGIGYFITLIYGWMKSAEWNIKGLMMAYTGCFLVGLALTFAGYGMMVARMVNDPAFKQQLEDMQNGEFEPGELELEVAQ